MRANNLAIDKNMLHESLFEARFIVKILSVVWGLGRRH